MALTLSASTFQRDVPFQVAILGAAERSRVIATSSDLESLTTRALYVFDATRHLLQVGWLLTGTYRATGAPTVSLTEYPFGGGTPVTNTSAVTVQAGAVAPVVSLTSFASVDGTFYAFVNGIDPNARVDAISSDGISVEARRAHTYDGGRRNAGIVLTGKLRFGGSPTFSLIVRTPPLGAVTLASVMIDGGGGIPSNAIINVAGTGLVLNSSGGYVLYGA